ncbi:MAG: type II toxin-antitoxin system MqsR family toxin [Desulfamplus sp.]|nr:type II toxin-antitoxin system MqsR family toxin [Desulfamplus sp.]
MEKHIPHYSLAEIKAQMTTIESMNLTVSAMSGIRKIGMAKSDALSVVQELTWKNFYKSMTTYNNNSIWQDVYHTQWKDIGLYVKFQRANEYFIISFKEL